MALRRMARIRLSHNHNWRAAGHPRTKTIKWITINWWRKESNLLMSKSTIERENRLCRPALPDFRRSQRMKSPTWPRPRQSSLDRLPFKMTWTTNCPANSLANPTQLTRNSRILQTSPKNCLRHQASVARCPEVQYRHDTTPNKRKFKNKHLYKRKLTRKTNYEPPNLCTKTS